MEKKEIDALVRRKHDAAMERAKVLMRQRVPGTTYAHVCEAHAARPDPELATLPCDAFVGLYVKMALTDPSNGKTEHVWINCDGTKGEDLEGTVDNDTNIITHVKSGDRVTFTPSDIEEILDPRQIRKEN